MLNLYKPNIKYLILKIILLINSMDDEKERVENYKNEFNNRLIWLLIFMISTIYSSIFYKINSFNTSPFICSYFQTSIFTIFIPISFIINSFSKNIIHHKKFDDDEEYEESKNNLLQRYKDNFSEYMEKQFYEVFYYYYTSFYKFAIFIGTLFFISQVLFNYSSLYLIPLFQNISICLMSIFILLAKLFYRGIKLSILNFLIIFFNVFFCLSIFITIHFIIPIDKIFKDNMLGIIYISLYILFMSILIIFYKNKMNKYFYYIDLNELTGFSGCFIMIFFPIIFAIITYFYQFQNEKNIILEDDFLFFLIKCFISSCIGYYSFIQLMKFYTSTVLSIILNIRVGILYFIYYFFTNNNKGEFEFFCFIVLLVFILIVLLICKIIYLGKKMKKKKRISLVNN